MWTVDANSLSGRKSASFTESICYRSKARKLGTLFQLEGVTKTYGAVTAMDDLSVTVPIGCNWAAWANGSGKTTMIRTLLGLIPVDAGSGQVWEWIFWIVNWTSGGSVGFAPENECLFPAVEGIGFVAYAGELVGMRPKMPCSGRMKSWIMSALARHVIARWNPTRPA